MAITMSQTALISIVIESMFIGIFSVLFWYSQTILRKRGYNKFLWGACVVMYIFAVTHFIIDAVRLNIAFVALPPGVPDSEAFLTTLSSPTFILKSAVYEAQTLLGDACLIYRTYVVWGKNYWIIAVPVLLFVADAITAIALLDNFATLPISSTIFVLAPWGIGYLFATLIVNIICTLSIAFRILRHSLRSSFYGAVNSSPFKPAMIVIVESGAVYSVALIATVAVFMSASWGHFIVLDSLSAIIGITFTAIIILLRRLEKNQSLGTASGAHASSNKRISIISGPNGNFNRNSAYGTDLRKAGGALSPTYMSEMAHARGFPGSGAVEARIDIVVEKPRAVEEHQTMRSTAASTYQPHMYVARRPVPAAEPWSEAPEERSADGQPRSKNGSRALAGNVGTDDGRFRSHPYAAVQAGSGGSGGSTDLTGDRLAPATGGDYMKDLPSEPRDLARSTAQSRDASAMTRF